MEEEPGLEGREREHVAAGWEFGAFRVGQFEQRARDGETYVEFGSDLGEGGHGAVAEDVPRGEGESGRTDAADQLHGDDAVATEGEEVVPGADPVQAEHGRVQAGQELFARRARQGGADFGGEVGRRKGTAVELAVGGDREGRHLDEGGGDHVLGQGGRQVGAECGRVDGPAIAHRNIATHDRAATADHVRNQALSLREHGGVGDRRVPGEGGLDLAEFDPEAPDLDLVVGAAEEFEYAVASPAGQVAGAVHTRARPAERVGDEAFAGQRGAAEVAARELASGQVELPGGPGRDGVERGVQDVRAGVPDRPPDGHARRSGRDLDGGDVH